MPVVNKVFEKFTPATAANVKKCYASLVPYEKVEYVAHYTALLQIVQQEEPVVKVPIDFAGVANIYWHTALSVLVVGAHPSCSLVNNRHIEATTINKDSKVMWSFVADWNKYDVGFPELTKQVNKPLKVGNPMKKVAKPSMVVMKAMKAKK